MKIRIDSFKTEYITPGGSGPHSAYIDAEINHLGMTYFLGTDKHSDELILLIKHGEVLIEAHRERGLGGMR